MTRRAPFERDVNTVFQDYAIFPHMTVIDNVAYGLRVRGAPRARRRERAPARRWRPYGRPASTTAGPASSPVGSASAPVEVYERPLTKFVAGFVGTSNLLTGPTAEAVLGREGVFSVRPEKIRVDGPELGPDEISTTGRVAEVNYAGPATRFVVDLDAGGRLVAVAQNQQTSATDVQRLRDRAVRLAWHREHVIAVPDKAVPQRNPVTAAEV